MKSKMARGVATAVTAIALPIVMYVCVILIYKLYRFIAGLIDPSNQDFVAMYGILVLAMAIASYVVHRCTESDIKIMEERNEAKDSRDSR